MPHQASQNSAVFCDQSCDGKRHQKVDALSLFFCHHKHARTAMEKRGRILTFILTLNVSASESDINR